MSLMPDPSFYPSPGMAMQAAPEHVYATLLNTGKNGKRCHWRHQRRPKFPTYGHFVGQVDFPNNDNELHHLAERVQRAGPHNPHPT